jgi:hypothetical protein
MILWIPPLGDNSTREAILTILYSDRFLVRRRRPVSARRFAAGGMRNKILTQ